MICVYHSQKPFVLTAAARNRSAQDLIRTRFPERSGTLGYRGAGCKDIINDQNPLSGKLLRFPGTIGAGDICAALFCAAV